MWDVAPLLKHLPCLLSSSQNLGLDWDERVLPSIGNEVLKSVVAQYQAEQLLTQRDKVSAAVRSELNQRAAEFNILIDDVAITHLSFGAEVRAREWDGGLWYNTGMRNGALTTHALLLSAAALGETLTPCPPLFLPQFTKAVEAKQVAQQEAERARFVVMKADQVRRWGGAMHMRLDENCPPAPLALHPFHPHIHPQQKTGAEGGGGPGGG